MRTSSAVFLACASLFLALVGIAPRIEARGPPDDDDAYAGLKPARAHSGNDNGAADAP